MRSILTIFGIMIGSLAASAQADVLKGKITKFGENIGSTTLNAAYCPNKQGESWMCTAITLENVTIEGKDGKENKVAKLMIPGETSGGMMGVGPSGDTLHLALALTPKNKWAELSSLAEFYQSVEVVDLNYVLIEASNVTPSAETDKPELVGLAQLKIVVKLTKAGVKMMVEDAKQHGKQPESSIINSATFNIDLGTYLDLSSLSK